MMMRSALIAVAAIGLLAACDPAGPADTRVQLIPIMNPEDRGSATTQSTGGGAPLDAMRPDASPIASSAPGAVTPTADASTELAAAATAAVTEPAESQETAVVAADGAALAAFAKSNTHAPGAAAYGRSFSSPERAERACARYASADQAQTAFLAAGGPQQDPKGMDPDGDGYVCGWDPAAFRSASAS